MFECSSVQGQKQRANGNGASTVCSALAVQSVVNAGTVFGFVPMIAHHLIKHTLDLLIAALALYAVYRSGPTQPQQVSRSE
ncbi:DUF7471 family protein [Halalkalicoccus jeotgali]